MSLIVPLPGPIDADPTREVARLARSDHYTELRSEANPAYVLAQRQLRAAVETVELGTYDQLIIEWINKSWATGSIATIASLLRRAFEAGIERGRAEFVVNEKNELLIERYVGALDAISRATRDVDEQLRSEMADRQYLLEGLVAAITKAFAEVSR